MSLVRRWFGISGLLLFLLLGCTAEQDRQYFEQQKYFFLESLQQIDAGGRQLQLATDQRGVTEALARLDEGLKLAFQVERKFLDELDLRLGKNYQRYFIEGIENYRLGIEAGDEQQQRQGLQQLARWAEFWSPERAAIEARLVPE